MMSGYSFVRPLGASGLGDVILFEQNAPRRPVAMNEGAAAGAAAARVRRRRRTVIAAVFLATAAAVTLAAFAASLIIGL